MKRAVVLSVLIACAVVGVVCGETRVVPGEYATIQTAIDAAAHGDTVLVMPGMYYETIDFRGKNITVTSIDPHDPLMVGYTIIHGMGNGSIVTFANGETSAAVLTGFTLTGGIGTRNTQMEEELTGDRSMFGGGIFCFRASPTIKRNVINGNNLPFNITGPTQADIVISCGGGISVYDGSPTIIYNIIRNNDAYAGGGIFCYFGEPTIHNNVISGNAAYVGGGLFSTSGLIYNNTIVANDCSVGGGDGLAGNLYIAFYPELGYTRLFNNIIANADSGGGILVEGNPDFGVFAYNNVWGNSPTNYYSYDQGQDFTGINGNISADPLFVSAINRDYRLMFGSPCIDAGDPGFTAPSGQTDIEGNPRTYGLRTDMGAYEYVGYIKPVALAGRDVHLLDPSQAVTLDGSNSFFYDPQAVKTYQWTQVSGPDGVFDDPTSPTPTFMPSEPGMYVFELIVADDQYASEPDQVLIFIGPNHAPIADAGEDRVFQAPVRVSLDGSGSYDPDPIDALVYNWTQIEGPPVTLDNADRANASFEAEPGHVYAFELVVSDGIDASEPSHVRLVAVGATRIVSPLTVESLGGPYLHYADVSGTKIVGVVNPATSNNWSIAYRDIVSHETETFSAPGINTRPKIDGDLVVWYGGASILGDGARVCTSVFARNVATGQQVTLRTLSQTESFSHPVVSGNTVVWVEHRNIDRNIADQWYDTPYNICGADVSDLANPVYFTIAAEVGRRDPFPLDRLMNDFDSVVDICGDIVVWEGNGNIYAANIADRDNIQVFTVCDDPARQYDPAVSGNYVVWTDLRNGDADIYGADISDPENIRIFAVAKGPGSQMQPAIDGAVVVYLDGSESGGMIKMACITRNHGVLIPREPEVAYGITPALDGSTVVHLSGLYGPIRATRLVFGYSIFDGVFENLATGLRYDYLRHAVADARDGGVIVVPEGIHRERIDFAGNAVTVRSADPNDPAVVAATVFAADGTIVTFAQGEGPDSVLDGLTITGGHWGIFCSGASPTIRRCRIEGNRGSAVRMLNRSNPALIECAITGNGGDGIEMWASGGGRATAHNVPVLTNCLIAGNAGAGLAGGQPILENCTIVENLGEAITSVNGTLKNCIVYFNNPTGGSQISSSRIVATYCNVQGGWPGVGNIDADPQFVQPGHWLDGVWLPGDYHLKSQGWRWDSGAGAWTSDDVTSPCIEAGDPASPLRDEPVVLPTGPVVNERINMGVYGGTGQASIAP